MQTTEDKETALSNFKNLMNAMNAPASPFKAPCNLQLGMGYSMQLTCGATGLECKIPCTRGVNRVNAFPVTFPTRIDFGVKESNKAFVLSRSTDLTHVKKASSLEFIVLVEEMREFEFFEYPILAFPSEYNGKSKELVKIW